MKTVTAINPGKADYELAGSLAGTAAADGYLEHVRITPVGKRATWEVVQGVWLQNIVTGKEHMRAKGATEVNLAAWEWAFVQALKQKIGVRAASLSAAVAATSARPGRTP